MSKSTLRSKFFTLLGITVCTLPLQEVCADQATPVDHEQEIAINPTPAHEIITTVAAVKAPEVPFSPFTGKVKGKKVRMRLKADLDSQVIREMGKNELISVIGEKGDFWAVQAPAGIKAYVFRSFILDGVVEGNRVNVRLEPSTDAPVIGHLTTGEKVQGSICASNNKWLEIAPPAQTRFYVAKEYVENTGGPEVKIQADKRRVAAEQLFDSAVLLGKAEMRKAFEEMDIDRLTHSFKTIVNEYTDLPEYVEKAKEQLASLQEAYVQKRLTFLENKSHNRGEEAKAHEVKADTQALAQVTDRMKMWEPIEEALYLSSAQANEEKSMEQYYADEKLAAVTLTGVLEAYTDQVRNKPGDFIVRDKGIPVAYVYSTSVNLQSLVGKKVSLVGTSRPKNNFAFPAYYVHSVE